MIDIKLFGQKLMELGLLDNPMMSMRKDQILEIGKAAIESMLENEFSLPYLDESGTLHIPSNAPDYYKHWLIMDNKESSARLKEILESLNASEDVLVRYGVVPRFILPRQKGLDPEVIKKEFPKFCSECCTKWNSAHGVCGSVDGCERSLKAIKDAWSKYEKNKEKVE